MHVQVYFVSGGSRGIGFQIVSQLSNRENTKVIATSTNPTKSTELQELARERGNIHILKYDASSEEDAETVRKEITELVDGIDILIFNAGIANSSRPVLETPSETWYEHYKVNTLGPIFLYQALYPQLLKKKTRKILFISSIVGSIGNYYRSSVSAYGQSKAALNYTVKEISYETENDNTIAVAVHPGGVDTDMAKAAIQRSGNRDAEVFKKMFASMITPNESASKLIQIIDKLTPEDSGNFFNFTGDKLVW